MESPPNLFMHKINITPTTAAISALAIYNIIGPVLKPFPNEGEVKTCNTWLAHISFSLFMQIAFENYGMYLYTKY